MKEKYGKGEIVMSYQYEKSDKDTREKYAKVDMNMNDKIGMVTRT